MDLSAGRFVATPEKGEVSYLLLRPPQAECCLVLGHGASSHYRHLTVESIATALAHVGVASFRYNFPYSEVGGGRNSNEVCIATIRSAVETSSQLVPKMSLIAAGHSFSGRMPSIGAAEHQLDGIRGLVFYSFPLHPSGKPSIIRGDHLNRVIHPMLFLSGTRDALAEVQLLESVCATLGNRVHLHLVDTADHSFKILKRSRQITDDPYNEMARVVQEWSHQL